jgi:putative membrane protein
MSKMKPVHVFLFFINLAVLIWSGINPTDRMTWLMEVGPSTIVFLILIFSYKKFRFSTTSYVIFSILIILTYIGGHFTYDDVPLFEWLKNVLNLKRNHYDRLGHFMKGLLVVPMKEFLLRKGWLKQGWLLNIIVVSFVVSLAAFYEIAEWIAALIVGKSAREFLGTQGDIWDSEWDMALAWGSAMLSLFIFRKNKV